MSEISDHFWFLFFTVIAGNLASTGIIAWLVVRKMMNDAKAHIQMQIDFATQENEKQRKHAEDQAKLLKDYIKARETDLNDLGFYPTNKKGGNS